MYTQTQTQTLHALSCAVVNTPKGDIVEVGSCAGGSTKVLIEAAKGVNKKVISVDPYEKVFEKYPAYSVASKKLCEWRESFKTNILDVYDKDIVVQYNEDITECIDKIPDGLSVVFIDGCHDYDAAINDFNLLVKKLVIGGALFLDDSKWANGQAGGKGLSKVADKICAPYFSDIKIFGSYFTKYGIKQKELE